MVPPDADRRKGPARPARRPLRFIRRVLATDWGKELYRKRQGSVEPVFANTSPSAARPLPTPRQSAARSEWRLIAATHNLLKLHTHTLAADSA